MRSTLLLTAALAVTVIGAGCTGDSSAPGEARLQAEGAVYVARPGRGFVAVTGTRTLSAGDRVRVRDGSAHIVTADGAALEMARDTDLRMAKVPALVRGHLLVTTGKKAAKVGVGPADVTTSGISHLARQLSSSVSTYRGRATVESVGKSLTVPALREATVPALGIVPGRPAPLSYDADDRWDRRFLSAAIELGEQLEAASRGIEAQFGRDEGRTPGFYRTLVPQLEDEPGFDAVFQPGRERGETLIGAVVAVTGREGSFTRRWESTFAFRDAGAQWGLVALDQKATSARLTDTLHAALGLVPAHFAAPPAPAPADPSRPDPGPAGPRGGPQAPPATGEPPPPEGPLPTVPPVPPIRPPDDADGLLPPVVSGLTDAAVGLVGGLLGTVGGLL